MLISEVEHEVFWRDVMLVTKRYCDPGSGWYLKKKRQLWQVLEYLSSKIMEAPLLALSVRCRF